jgi:hypothetical protein
MSKSTTMTKEWEERSILAIEIEVAIRYARRVYENENHSPTAKPYAWRYTHRVATGLLEIVNHGRCVIPIETV